MKSEAPPVQKFLRIEATSSEAAKRCSKQPNNRKVWRCKQKMVN